MNYYPITGTYAVPPRLQRRYPNAAGYTINLRDTDVKLGQAVVEGRVVEVVGVEYLGTRAYRIICLPTDFVSGEYTESAGLTA